MDKQTTARGSWKERVAVYRRFGIGGLLRAASLLKGTLATDSWKSPNVGFCLLRRLLGILLIAAAALKAHELLTEPLTGGGVLAIRPFVIGMINVEVFLGLWLLLGGFPRCAWFASLFCFAIFAQASFSNPFTAHILHRGHAFHQ